MSYTTMRYFLLIPFCFLYLLSCKPSFNLEELEKYLFPTNIDEYNRTGLRTDAVVILYKGSIVYEKYARGYHAEKLHPVWSISKQFVHALYGIAQYQGILDWNDFAYKYEPMLASSQEKKAIRIIDLLQFSSGLVWNESYEDKPLYSSVIAMLYTRGRDNMGQFVSGKEFYLRAPPGTHIQYSSGSSNILMNILKNALNDEQKYLDFPFEELFSKIDVKNIAIERDTSLNYVGSSYVFTTARDLAKLGLLYLNSGVSKRERLFDTEAMKICRTLPPSFFSTYKKALKEKNVKTIKRLSKFQYTAHCYTNQDVKSLSLKRPVPALRDDTLFSFGHWGQYMIVMPEFDAVFVRLGDDKERGVFDLQRVGRHLKEILK